MLRYTRQVPKSAQTLESEHYHTKPEPSCFGIPSLISDNNQEGPYHKPHNKMTQSGIWAFNTVKRIAVAKKKK